MKIRSGFVSNSSSSSFIVKGFILDNEKFNPTEIMKRFGYLTDEVINKATHNGKYTWEDVEREVFWDFRDEHQDIAILEGYEDDMNDNQIFIGEKLFDSDVDYLPKMILEATDTDVTNKIRDTLGLRTGFVSNSSSSSFIITGKDNIEKAKYIIDNAQDIYGDYYEVNDKLFTSGISDCSEIFSQLCSLTQEDEACALNGEPYAGDDDEEVEDCYAILEGDRGVGTVYISKQYLDT